MLTTILLAALSVLPQTLSVTVPANTPFDVSFKHDGLLMPSFRWWCDGAIAKNFTATETRQPTTDPDANGRYLYTVTAPGLAIGIHTCWFTAFNDNGETKTLCTATVTTDCVTPITFTVGTPTPVGKPPAVPVDIRIVVRTGGV
jgi:hypothetical protein